jgi:ABC-2 type transport system permease protein
MSAQLRAELLKQRSTQTTLALLAGMIVLVGVAIALHILTPATSELMTRSDQLVVVEAGTRVSMLFAALVGALAITAEFRYGTIHPTFLVTPRRSPVIIAKLAVSRLIGLVFGLVTAGLMASGASAALAARGISIQLTNGDYIRLLIGGMVAAALWAIIGLGIGALVRNQIPTLVGLCAWLLFVEHLLPADAARYTPGFAGLGLAIKGAQTQLADTVPSPAVGIIVLASCTVAAAAVGWRATLQHDAA